MASKKKSKTTAKKKTSAPKTKSKVKAKLKAAPKAAKSPSGGAKLKSSGPAKAPKAKFGPVSISPVRSRVIIRREEGDDRTPGGLYVPDSAKERPVTGVVVAVGTGRFSKKGVKRPLEVQVGDRVVFSRYTGSPIQHNEQELLVVDESEIIGVFNN